LSGMAYPILMYHQIDVSPPRGTPLRGLTVTPEKFARQMGFLKLMGYRGVCMTELEPYLRGEITGKVVGITFDDGYRNNLEYALPILCKHGFSATCYAVSNPGQGFNSWDAINGVPQKPLLSPNEMRDWVNAGMELGAHTRHHADLTAINPQQAMDEISGCKQELEAHTGREVRHFCYPYGRYDPTHIQMVQQAGYLTATTTHRGRVKPGDDLFELRRVLIAHSNHLALFWAKTLLDYEDRHR
jgi:peptidoglycan/xylan/chitin deacetylase (PgdA/CDA1 family)